MIRQQYDSSNRGKYLRDIVLCLSSSKTGDGTRNIVLAHTKMPSNIEAVTSNSPRRRVAIRDASPTRR
jgi:hypothetical protein